MARRTETNYSRAAKAFMREIKYYEREMYRLGKDSPEGIYCREYAARLRACLESSIPAEHIPA